MSSRSIELETQLIERNVERRNVILARADEKAKKILNSAEGEVERIRAETERQILALVDSELRAVRDRMVGRAELEGRKNVMFARQELISGVFEEAKKRLEDVVKGPGYGEILHNLISEAASAIGGEEFIVAGNKTDMTYLKKNLGKISADLKQILGEVTIKFGKESIDVMGGFVVTNGDGTKIYHNTLEGRLERVRGRVEANIAKVLGLI